MMSSGLELEPIPNHQRAETGLLYSTHTQYSVEKLNDFGFWFMYGAAQYPVPSTQCSVLSAPCSMLHAPCSVLCTLYLYSTQTHSLGTQYLSALIHAAQFDNASSKGLPQNHF